ncbi:NAD(P)-dependent oxidoreductase [Gracilaria domingensis]|nr:NAD(P)-dependent oxidoreductase [Gracilaria domingensis]
MSFDNALALTNIRLCLVAWIEVEAGASVAGVTRSSASKLETMAFVDYHIRNSTHVLSTVAPDASRNEDPILAQHGDLLRNPHSVKWLGYLSSTSVYGDHGGALVDENSSILNPSLKGQLRLEVENKWLDLAKHVEVPTCIFRVAGIYGPGRNALQTLLRNPNVVNQTKDTLDMIVSRIHVADLANAVTSAICLETGETDTEISISLDQVYNISDDLPASRRSVFTYAEALLRNLELSQDNTKYRYQPLSVRHRIRASKQVSNAKMKNKLVPNLHFPSYREGLGAIAQELRESKRLSG